MSGVECFLVEPVDSDPGHWRRVDTGEVFGPGRLPAGAMWEAPWMGDGLRVNGDGPVLVVRLPDGRDWMPGSQAANCGRANERPRRHDCWCVHGDPPRLTVDKQPEPGRTTCGAGMGSIGPPEGAAGGWHGFLRDGRLVDA